MANKPSFFNFYRRYKWTAQNFTDFQSAVLDDAHGASEGAYGAAVLDGFTLSLPGGLGIDASEGIATGASGYLMASDAASGVTLTAPTGFNMASRSIIVARPLLVDDDTITKPTSPYESVPLRQIHDCEIVAIQGTESATPEYPAKESNDVILGGVRLITGQSSIAEEDLDFSIKEIIGRNSEIGQHTFRNDDRLRPYRSTSTLLGVKPSQTSGSDPLQFSYSGNGYPSIYPKDSGLYNHADTFLNFSSGAITGGDTTSSAFTPTIPTANNSIVATVFLNSDDTIGVDYGTEGTLAQCLSGIKNQVTVGAGSISQQAAKYKLAYVIVTSINGSFSDIQVFDARAAAFSSSSSIGLASSGTEALAGNLALNSADDGKVILVDASAQRTITLPSPTEGFKVTIKDATGEAGTNPIIIEPNSTELIDGSSSDYEMGIPNGAVSFISNGTDWFTVTQGGISKPVISRLTSTGTTAGYLFTCTSANATVGATYTNNGNTYTVLGTISGGTRLFCSGASAPTSSGTLTKSAGTGDASITFSSNVTLAAFTSTAGAKYLKVRGVAGGGGGGGSGNSAPSAATAGEITAFGPDIVVVGGGLGEAFDSSTGAQGGAGGTGGQGTDAVRYPGNGGGAGDSNSRSKNGQGGGSALFGGAPYGVAVSSGSVSGTAGSANTGAGGAGGVSVTATYIGCGGGAGESFLATLYPGTYYYHVGVGGSAGTGALANGGAGAAGVIEIEEHFI